MSRWIPIRPVVALLAAPLARQPHRYWYRWMSRSVWCGRMVFIFLIGLNMMMMMMMMMIMMMMLLLHWDRMDVDIGHFMNKMNSSSSSSSSDSSRDSSSDSSRDSHTSDVCVYILGLSSCQKKQSNNCKEQPRRRSVGGFSPSSDRSIDPSSSTIKSIIIINHTSKRKMRETRSEPIHDVTPKFTRLGLGVSYQKNRPLLCWKEQEKVEQCELWYQCMLVGNTN